MNNNNNNNKLPKTLPINLQRNPQAIATNLLIMILYIVSA